MVLYSFARPILGTGELRRLCYPVWAYIGFGATVPSLYDRSVWTVIALSVVAMVEFERMRREQATSRRPSRNPTSHHSVQERDQEQQHEDRARRLPLQQAGPPDGDDVPELPPGAPRPRPGGDQVAARRGDLQAAQRAHRGHAQRRRRPAPALRDLLRRRLPGRRVALRPRRRRHDHRRGRADRRLLDGTRHGDAAGQDPRLRGLADQRRLRVAQHQGQRARRPRHGSRDGDGERDRLVHVRRQRRRERPQRPHRPRGAGLTRSRSRRRRSTKRSRAPEGRSSWSRSTSRARSTTSSCRATPARGPTYARSSWSTTPSRVTASRS